MRSAANLFTALCLLACAGPDADLAKDPTDPLLIITSPARGTVSEGAELVVTGTASDPDSGIEAVTVNGVEAVLDGDAFRAVLTLAPGTNAIETIARDKSGNQSIDIRSALHGEFAAPGPVDNAVVIRIGKPALQTIGDTAGEALLATDFAPSLAAVNPVLDKGGSCLGARADVTSVDFATVDIDLFPTNRELHINATVSDLAVGVHLDYDIACIGGRRDIVSRANTVALEVAFEVAVSGGALVFDTTQAQVTLSGVNLGIGGLPTALIELVVGDIETKIANALTSLLASELEPQLQAAFDTLTSARTVSLLGRDVSLDIKPQLLSITDEAVLLTTRSHITVAGATGTGYVASPRSAPELRADLAASIADDALGQAVGALWASGAFTRDIPLTGDSGANLGGGIADSVSIEALLPPMIAFEGEGGAALEIADLIVLLHREGAPVSELAVSAKLALSISSGPRGVVMMAAEPELLLQLLTPDGFLTEHDLVILEAFLGNYLQGDLSSLVGEIPLPSFAGTSVGSIASQSGAGYLTMDIEIAAGTNQ